MIILIDTREQAPYKFPEGIATESAALPTGDYSVKGLEAVVAVERKTKADAYSSMGAGRKRFEREFERMAEMRYAAVVIECSMEELLHSPPLNTRMSPRAVVASYISWSVMYRVHVWFAGSRTMGMATTLRILKKSFELFSPPQSPDESGHSAMTITNVVTEGNENE